MYHSGNVAQQAAGPATGLLDPRTEDRGPDTEAVFYQRCTWCGTAVYHRVLCPVCRGSELRTERSEGTGTVRHATVVHRNTPPHAMSPSSRWPRGSCCAAGSWDR